MTATRRHHRSAVGRDVGGILGMFGHLGRGAVHGAKQDARALNHHITEDDLHRIIGASVVAAKSAGKSYDRFGRWAQNPAHDPVRATYRTLRHPGDKGKPVGYTRSLFVNPDKNHPYKAWPPKEMLRSADNLTGAWTALNPSTLLYPEAQALGLAGKKMPEWRKEQADHIGAILSGLPVGSVESGGPLDQAITKNTLYAERRAAPGIKGGGVLLSGAEVPKAPIPWRTVDRLSGGAVKMGVKNKGDLWAKLEAATAAPPLYFHGGPHPNSHRLHGRQLNRGVRSALKGHIPKADLQVPDFVRRIKTDAELRFPSDKIAQGLYVAHRTHLHEMGAKTAVIALQQAGGTAVEHGLGSHLHNAVINVHGTVVENKAKGVDASESESEGAAASRPSPPKMPATRSKAPAHLTGRMHGARGYRGRN